MVARHSNILFVSSGSVSLRCFLFFKHLDDKNISVPRVRIELTTFRFLNQIMRLTRCLLR